MTELFCWGKCFVANKKNDKTIFYISIVIFLFSDCQSKKHKNSEKKIDSVKIIAKEVIKIDTSAKIKIPIKENQKIGIVHNTYKAKDFYDEKIKVDSNNVPINSNQIYFPIKLFPCYDIFKETYIENKFDTFSVMLLSCDLF
jgi:hypothetical protein